MTVFLNRDIYFLNEFLGIKVDQINNIKISN